MAIQPRIQSRQTLAGGTEVDSHEGKQHVRIQGIAVLLSDGLVMCYPLVGTT